MRPVPGEVNPDDDSELDEFTALRLSSLNVSGQGKVTLDNDGVLHWPVLFVYPEHSQTDFIQAFNENDR